MKSFILSLLIVVFSFKSFSAQSANQQHEEFKTQAFELLVKNVDKIKLIGDISPDEKLKPILDDLGDFIGELLSSAMIGHDDNEYTGHIREFTTSCEQPTKQKVSAQCEIIIQYMPLGETALSFEVLLDKNNKPISIIKNRVYVSRGS